MKIGSNLFGFDISASGLAVQRKKMNLIAENIANAQTTKTSETGEVYKKKYLSVSQDVSSLEKMNVKNDLKMKGSNQFHISSNEIANADSKNELVTKEEEDQKEGELVYMPGHPDADEQGYVMMPNVNIITEMVDMISASRSFEANIMALNSSKQMAKDALEI